MPPPAAIGLESYRTIRPDNSTCSSSNHIVRNVYTLTLIAQKGGTGKTTLAINLSVAAEIGGWRTAILDLDPQASAAGWGDQRERDGPAVVPVPASRLEAALETSRRHGADLAVIDTAPHSEASALAAARAADLALVPLRPGVLDLRALGATAEICTLARARTAVALNATPHRGPLADQAAEAIAQSGLDVAPCRIGARIAFQHSITRGLGVVEHDPNGKAAAEICALWRWSKAQLDG